MKEVQSWFIANMKKFQPLFIDAVVSSKEMRDISVHEVWTSLKEWMSFSADVLSDVSLSPGF